MTKREAIALAKEYAELATEHSYTQVSGFKPHSWVVAAIMEAHMMGIADGLGLAESSRAAGR